MNQEFPTPFCNNSVKSERKFRNSDTNWEYVIYRDYSTVNHYYKSWNIEGMVIEDNLSWKYITYPVAKNLNSFFPEEKQPDVSSWGVISKSEAIKTINNL